MRRKVLPVVAACAAVLGTSAGLAAAQGTTTVKMTARLTATTLQVVKTPNASGRFAGTLVRYSNGRSGLAWTLTYQNLSSRATRAEVVVPPINNKGELSVVLCQPCKPSGHGVVKPILKYSTRVLFTRNAYVIVFTKKNRRGEIRGRVVKST